MARQVADGTSVLPAARGCVGRADELDACVEGVSKDGIPVREVVERCFDLLEENLLLFPTASTTTTVEATDTTTSTATGTGASEPGGLTGAAADGQDPTADAPNGSEGSDGVGPLGLAAIVLLAGALGAGAATLVARRRVPAGAPAVAAPGPPTTGPAPAPGPTPGTAPIPAPSADVGDRRTLVEALVQIGDLVTSDALRTTVAERLAAVGVLPLLVAPGTRFDPTLHRGVQADEARTPDEDGTVASCDRAGWSDRGEVLRPPEVVVHRWSGS